ncbi:pilus assembly protein TadG-related protein [Saxibacter everestensis]|uniref:Pilus assembly protein TadG-related protein n=1 Tax=Saxibacter everestensis TaxID=2909229 RepID=A0ABY8QUH2_9MICO|nr:pilus assembly protein TadG-related protein [Brevibacteriaceae bacterium ZFBP1038]
MMELRRRLLCINQGDSDSGCADRGSVSPMVPILTIVILLLGGLIVDSGRQLNARGRAVAYAQEAARAGAARIDLTSADLRLQPVDQVAQAVATYCAEVEADGAVTSCEFRRIDPVSASDDRKLVVVVDVTLSVRATLMGIVGVQELNASGTGRARPFEGVDEPEA